VVLGAAKTAGSDFGGSFALPDTDSEAAVTLLAHNLPSASGEGDEVVIQAAHGATIGSAGVRTAVSAALARVARVPGVAAVAGP
jgi:RND superfamily putative drug exporter